MEEFLQTDIWNSAASWNPVAKLWQQSHLSKRFGTAAFNQLSMKTNLLSSQENLETPWDSIEARTSGNRDGGEGRSLRSGRAHKSRGQRGRRCRRGGAHTRFTREACPDASVAPPLQAVESLLVAPLSFSSGEGEEETVQGRKRKLEEFAEE